MPGREIFGIPVIHIVVTGVFMVLWWIWSRAKTEAGYHDPDQDYYDPPEEPEDRE